MKGKSIIGIVLILLIVLLLPAHSIHAASTGSIKTKTYSYKGQQYVQIVGGDKKVSGKINKILKSHAVATAKGNAEVKKMQKHYYLNSTAKTKYASDKKLSVVYEDSLYSGGAHSNEIATTYNFDLKTGKQLFLNNVTENNQQKYNLMNEVEAGLKVSKEAYSDLFHNFPLTNKSSFYFYNDGVVIVFNPYEVGPYAAGFIEVKVPLKKINAVSEVPLFNLNKATLDTLSQGIVPGFKGVRLGQSQAEVTRILNTSAGQSYYESGGLFWILKGIDYASFNFDDESTDSLRNVYLGTKAFPMKTFKDIEKILGKTERYESSNYDGDVLISYELGKVYIEFTSDLHDETESINGIMISKR
ncbi:DUF3298 and DUF4163 domain-containing protein [Paenibacillus taichungensis]|uniref:DUF3298 and DUF4163 domain-containing protein n=1 Tax=Paenibacillus taichungensis TaxID=484184 RepID=UPI002871CE82|nr:DUF3298 domain-containing protein [Paenibacillus taichungensis]MDR9748538.1 DUF3298 domain-containing protein [Paenibacillus taichungensis]